ncbi:SCAP [Bugula neritina]|uniref:SCAP n=1 Tax=Bugula neritina TaxID=10212 RepID=A0A7J7J6J8_BUGNE|nr:SCAP [Bugula neritina]
MFRPAFPRFVQLQERVKSLFYSYGLFCATHQLSTILFAVISVLFVIYPLRNIPILGNTSQMYEMPLSDYNVGEKSSASPRWYSGPPIGYVQQILVKSTVAPSHPYKAPTLADLYTAPLHTSFTILEQINRLQVGDGTSGKKLTISDVCLHVSEPDANVQGSRFLPQFDCLILSPANLWHNQKEVFESDKEILQTVQSSAQNSYEASPRMRDLLFGVPWRESGMSKFFVRNRERTVQYSITIIYKTYNPEYIKQLTDTLLSLYPLSLVNSNVSQTITHVSYREHTTSYIADYTPLIAAYLILFLYIYFSVQKIEMVKSKWGLAFSAVITVVCSLLMSISICAVFGVTPSVNSGEIFPYLVVIVGLENVLVVTRSVVSTPLNLEVKFRIAEGLRMEGWNITKHLMTELVILAFGFLTFVPAIQEFCLFASIGLLVDFYLQMFFFATVLSIDIRRLELSDLGRGHTYLHVQSDTGRVLADDSSTTVQPDLNPSPAESDTFIVASLFHIPKRIKVMNFVAQFRVVQRLMMLCTVIWISLGALQDRHHL